jgi:RimJ/RimL family protein N-acetyltransferase
MKTPNIYIRILEKTDIIKTTAWLNDPEISDIMGYLPVFTVDNQLKWHDLISVDNTRYIFAICLGDIGEHIGNVGLGNIDYIHRHAMVNIFIMCHEYRGKGIGTQAMDLILQFAFNRLNLNKVFLRTSSRFEGAIQLYEKLGFVREGVMRQHYYTDGAWEDKIIYSLLRSEYTINKPELK